MCLYPKLIKNPKYKASKKNGGKIPAVYDIRLYVNVLGLLVKVGWEKKSVKLVS